MNVSLCAMAVLVTGVIVAAARVGAGVVVLVLMVVVAVASGCLEYSNTLQQSRITTLIFVPRSFNL